MSSIAIRLRFSMNAAETVMADREAGHADLHGDFRQAMRRLASAVAVVATAHGDDWVGMAATSVTSLSMEPPSLLICVNRSASIHTALSQGAAFSINILHESHRAISAAFGGSAKGAERFAVGDWRASSEGVPHLYDALASIACVVDMSVDYGTHTIVVGKVRQTHLSTHEHPLIYVNGQYL